MSDPSGFLTRLVNVSDIPTVPAGKVWVFGDLADGTPKYIDDTQTVHVFANSGVASSRTLTAGAGLTGGGNLTADRTFNVAANADGSIIVNADDIQVGILATDAQHGNRGNGSLHTGASFSNNGFLTAAEHIQLNSLNGLNSSGAVKRVFRPGDYMVGNTYDPTGVANSTSSFAAMKAAIVAFNDRYVIELPPGVFKLDNTVFTGLPIGSGGLLGPGRGNCVLIPSSAGTFITLPVTPGSESFVARGFTVYNTSGTPFTSGIGLSTNGGNNILAEELSFIDLFQDISVNGGSIKVSLQKLVHYQTNGSATSVGILVDNGLAGDTYIGPDIVMSNGGATRRAACVNIHESGHYEILQSNLTGSQRGILIDPAAGKIVGFGFHQQVLCDSCTVNGIAITAPTSTSTVKNIKSNLSWYSGTTGGGAGGVTTGVAGGIINGLTFTNDRFLNNGGDGFTHGFGTDVRWGDCDMKGNSLPANGGTTNTKDGLAVAAAVSNWSANGGKYGGSDTVPTATTQRYGITAAAGAGDNIRIAVDDLSGNATGPLQILATGVNIFIAGAPGLCPGKFLGADVVTSTTVSTTMIQSRIPQSSVRAGTLLRIRVSGQSSSTGTLAVTVRCGTTNDAQGAAATNAIAYTHPTSVAQVANSYSEYEFTVRVTTPGNPGRIDVGQGMALATLVLSNLTTAARASGAGFLAPNLTVDNYLSLAIACSVGTFTAIAGSIEVLQY